MSGRTAQRTFRSTRSSISGARKHTESICRAWKVGTELTESAVLVVSELATNAVLHAKGIGEFFELRIRRRRGVLVLEVTDSSSQGPPQPGYPCPEFADESAFPQYDAGFDATDASRSGRGLRIVEYFADTWGVRQRANGPGKTVWAHLDTTRRRP
ncbi:ATP-binding protein [Streptomyces gamaensis]|uniref:ATP-binding protein n=1 Tax=Streptomyces gamaensis TaxID=1763542 RepID=A0ABW0YYU7_9ACTN